MNKSRLSIQQFIPLVNVELAKNNYLALKNYIEHFDDAMDVSIDNVERRLYKQIIVKKKPFQKLQRDIENLQKELQQIEDHYYKQDLIKDDYEEVSKIKKFKDKMKDQFQEMNTGLKTNKENIDKFKNDFSDKLEIIKRQKDLGFRILKETEQLNQKKQITVRQRSVTVNVTQIQNLKLRSYSKNSIRNNELDELHKEIQQQKKMNNQLISRFNNKFYSFVQRKQFIDSIFNNQKLTLSQSIQQIKVKKQQIPYLQSFKKFRLDASTKNLNYFRYQIQEGDELQQNINIQNNPGPKINDQSQTSYDQFQKFKHDHFVSILTSQSNILNGFLNIINLKEKTVYTVMQKFKQVFNNQIKNTH